MLDQEEITNIQSPYIKTYNKSLEEIRQEIVDRKIVFEKNKFSPSPTLPQGKGGTQTQTQLQDQIEKVSKKIVGNEIRKFAELAGKEIETELHDFKIALTEDLNIKIENLENKCQNIFLQQNNLEQNFAENFENKHNLLNQKIEEIENRLQALEVYSVESINEIKEDLIVSEEILIPVQTLETISEPELIISHVLDDRIENTKSIEHDFEADLDVENYIENKLANIVSLFQTDGLLFRKNSYNTHLKDAEAKAVFHDEDKYTNLEKDMRSKICGVIKNLITSLNLNFQEEETINQFLTRALAQEYKIKRKSFLQNKLASLEKLVGVR